jgi:guanidinopropionase
MDLKKLEELRRKYGNAREGQIFDPFFNSVAQAGEFAPGSGAHPLPYGGIRTFLDAPLYSSAVGLDVALVGVPMDLGVTNRAGARHGPRAIREMERIGPYEPALKCAPAKYVKFGDIGDVPFRTRFSLEECHRDIERHFAAIRSAGALPLAVGGDHSITAPILRALGHDRPVGLVHIDAHADTMGVYEGSKFHHGGPFRTAVLDGVLDPNRTIQIGMRGTADFLWEFSYESGMTVVPADEIDRRGIDWVIRRALDVVGDQPTYVSFDVDALDPVFAPGTGTPEVGGLTTREALAILRGLDGIDIIGGDVVEVAPMYDTTTNTAHAGAQILFQILCLATTAHIRRSVENRTTT